MKLKLITLTACAVSLTIVSGCSDTSTGPNDQASAPLGPAWVDLTGHVNLSSPPGETSDLSSQEGLQQNLDAMERVREAVGLTHDWQQAERNVAELLASPAAAQNPKIRRLAPVALLRTHLLRTDDPDAAEAILEYTRILVEDRSPEVETVAEALEHIQGQASDRLTSALATEAAATGRAWAEGCSGCKSAGARIAVDADASPDSPLAAVSRAQREADADRVSAISRLDRIGQAAR